MVIMFAALSYAMTQGFRGGGATVTRENDRLKAQEVVSYLNQVKLQFNSLVIAGCSPLTISFDSDLYVLANGNPINAPPPSSPAHCAMFGSSNGITPLSFAQYASADYTATGTDPRPGTLNVRYADVQIGTSENDLVAFMPGMDLNTCVAVLNYVADTGQTFTAVPSASWAYGGNNSYTPGAAGAPDELTLPTGSMIWALRQTLSPDYCELGIVLKVL